MGDSHETNLTDRQIEVLQLRKHGLTQSAVAERLGTTSSNVSAIELAAEANIEKSRATLQLVHVIESNVQFDVPSGNSIDAIVESIYNQGDDADIRIDSRKPELYGQLYYELETLLDKGQLESSVSVGITANGRINVFPRSQLLD